MARYGQAFKDRAVARLLPPPTSTGSIYHSDRIPRRRQRQASASDGQIGLPYTTTSFRCLLQTVVHFVFEYAGERYDSPIASLAPHPRSCE